MAAPNTPTPVSKRAPEKSQVRTDWSERGVYWDKWSDTVGETADVFNRPLGAIAGIGPGMTVLDLASGAGEPALTFAAMVGPEGHVTATDLVPEMLAGAERRARARGLTNMSFKVADMENLDFPEASFDRVTCRFGIMFATDVTKAFREAMWVLKPGGMAAFMVWGPLGENALIAIFSRVSERLLGRSPWSDDLNPFRFPDPGPLGDAMRDAGLVAVREEPVRVAPRRPIDGKPFWSAQLDMGLGPEIDARGPEFRQAMNDAIQAELDQLRDGDVHVLPGHVRVVLGTRP